MYRVEFSNHEEENKKSFTIEEVDLHEDTLKYISKHPHIYILTFENASYTLKIVFIDPISPVSANFIKLCQVLN